MSTYELPLGKKTHQPNKPTTKPNHPPSPPLFPERLPQVISGLVSSRTTSKRKFQRGNSCCKVWAVLVPGGGWGMAPSSVICLCTLLRNTVKAADFGRYDFSHATKRPPYCI